LFAVFTGQHPSCNFTGHPGGRGAFNKDAITLARLFSSHGYNTAAITAKGQGRPERGLGTGFNVHEYSVESGEFPHVYPQAVKWLRGHRDERFFLLLHTCEVQQPYTRRLLTDTVAGKSELAARNYDSGILFADSYVRKLCDELAALGILENTVLIIFSGYGQDFRDPSGDDNDPVGHDGHCLYQTLLHVPFILAGPGIAEGRVISERVRSMDMMPTLLELFDIPIPQGIQASTLAPLVLGKAAARVPAGASYAESTCLGPERKALIRGDWKLIYTPQPGDAMGEEERKLRRMQSDSEEWYCALAHLRLYDLARDPQEQVNLFDQEQDRGASMLHDLRQIMERNEGVRRQNARGFTYYGLPDEEEARSLRALKSFAALGYVE
jgi:arylsulfatase A-like enzyme